MSVGFVGDMRKYLEKAGLTVHDKAPTGYRQSHAMGIGRTTAAFICMDLFIEATSKDEYVVLQEVEDGFIQVIAFICESEPDEEATRRSEEPHSSDPQNPDRANE
jgi:hypothetical protein